MLPRTLASVHPITLPLQAYGPQQVEWFDPKRAAMLSPSAA